MEDYKIKVSVVMPVYNSEDYLEKALESVCSQTLEEIEIICVDDGSTDGSKEIIKRFVNNDDRVHLIEQQNLFAGVARNNGFAEAKGEYVVFWDSDDFFKADALEIMYNKSVEDNADICLCNAYNYSEEKDKNSVSDEFVKYDILPQITPFNRNDVPEKIFNLGANVPWNKMFRTAFVRENNLKFQPLKQSNDTYFVLMAIFLADRITYTKRRLIHYRKNAKGSLTANAVNTPLCTFEAYSYLKEELEKLPFYSEDHRKSFINRTVRGVLRAIHCQSTQNGFDSVRQALLDGVLDRLGLIGEEEMYEAKWLYNDIQSLLNNTGTEHMIYKYNCAKKSKENFKSRVILAEERYEKSQKQLEKEKKLTARLTEKVEKKNENIQQMKVKLSENKEKLSETKEKLSETKEKLSETKEILSERNEQIKQDKIVIEKLEKELEDKNRKLMGLQGKWYVRLFSKIERILKRLLRK